MPSPIQTPIPTAYQFGLSPAASDLVPTAVPSKQTALTLTQKPTHKPEASLSIIARQQPVPSSTQQHSLWKSVIPAAATSLIGAALFISTNAYAAELGDAPIHSDTGSQWHSWASIMTDWSHAINTSYTLTGVAIPTVLLVLGGRLFYLRRQAAIVAAAKKDGATDKTPLDEMHSLVTSFNYRNNTPTIDQVIDLQDQIKKDLGDNNASTSKEDDDKLLQINTLLEGFSNYDLLLNIQDELDFPDESGTPMGTHAIKQRLEHLEAIRQAIRSSITSFPLEVGFNKDELDQLEAQLNQTLIASQRNPTENKLNEFHADTMKFNYQGNLPQAERIKELQLKIKKDFVRNPDLTSTEASQQLSEIRCKLKGIEAHYLLKKAQQNLPTLNNRNSVESILSQFEKIHTLIKTGSKNFGPIDVNFTPNELKDLEDSLQQKLILITEYEGENSTFNEVLTTVREFNYQNNIPSVKIIHNLQNFMNNEIFKLASIEIIQEITLTLGMFEDHHKLLEIIEKSNLSNRTHNDTDALISAVVEIKEKVESHIRNSVPFNVGFNIAQLDQIIAKLSIKGTIQPAPGPSGPQPESILGKKLSQNSTTIVAEDTQDTGGDTNNHDGKTQHDPLVSEDTISRARTELYGLPPTSASEVTEDMNNALPAYDLDSMASIERELTAAQRQGESIIDPDDLNRD